MKSKRCLVTGANSGVGWGTALVLAKQGAQVVMLCRNPEKGKAAQAEIIKQSGNSQVELMLCDLASKQQIQSFISNFLSRYDQLDLLVNNAAIVPPNRQVTADGIEMQLMVNVLAPFMLTQGLMPALQAAPTGRVVNLSALPTATLKPHFDDIQSERNYRIWGWQRYERTKTFLTLLTWGFAERLGEGQITFNGAHPGVVDSHILQGANPLSRWIMRTFFSTPQQGGERVVFAASDSSMAGKTGYYVKWNGQAIPISEFYNPETRDTMWTLAMQLASA